MSAIRYLLAALLLLCRTVPSPAATGEPYAARSIPPQPGGGPTVACGDGCTGVLFPVNDLYPPYLADPHRPGFAVQYQSYLKKSIPGAGANRVNLKVGGVLGLYRAETPADTLRAWQIGGVGALDGLFDGTNSLDNIGWNGHYSLQWSGLLPNGIAVRFGNFHLSSHLGDEYAEKHGTRRIGYTREELGGGISWYPTGTLRLYGDAGYGYSLGNRELMEPWRTRGGAEYQSANTLWDGRAGWYGAIDLTSMQERSWRIDSTLDAGLLMRSGGRLWRLGIEWYRGRPTPGEFFRATEQYISTGLWMDW